MLTHIELLFDSLSLIVSSQFIVVFKFSTAVKATAIGLTAVRETGVFRHHGAN